MTTCSRCGALIRLHGRIWMHDKPSIKHAATPARVAPITEAELRLMDGNR